jgi:hypothetical protein
MALARCLLVLALLVPATGIAAEFVPATVTRGDDSLLTRLDCPDARPGDGPTVLFCQALVRADGTAPAAHCFANRALDAQMADEVALAAEASTFAPARVDGEAVSVLYTWRTFLATREGRCRIGVLPNLGYEHEAFGLAYVAPQEIVTDESLFLRDRAMGIGRTYVGFREWPFRVRTEVDADGRPGAVRVIENSMFASRFVKRVVHGLAEARFIPGFVDGAPVAMDHHAQPFVPAVR